MPLIFPGSFAKITANGYLRSCRMKRLVVIFALFACFGAGAQEHVHIHHVGCEHGENCRHIHNDDGGVKIVSDFVGLAPRFSVSWQKEFFAEVGLSFDLYQIGYTEGSEYVSFGYRNLRPYVSGEIMLRGDKTIGGPKAGVEFIMSTNVFGMAVGGDVSWYTDGVRNAVAITPRLVLSFVYVELYYGYNIFALNELKGYLGNHRVGVSCTLNPRYWKRKKQFSEAYYESYL